MGMFCADSAPDALLAHVATATRLVVCSGQPANFAGIAAVALADVVMTAGAGNGDYTLADGDESGRKLTVAQQVNIPIDASGTATHVALDNGSTLLFVTQSNSIALTSGLTVNVAAFDIEIQDPTVTPALLAVADATHTHLSENLALDLGGAAEPVWTTDWDSFANTAAMLAGIYGAHSPESITLETTGSTPWGGTKFVRAHYPGGFNVAPWGTGNVATIGVMLNPTGTFEAREEWGRTWVRFVDWGDVSDDKGFFRMQNKPGIAFECDRWDWYPRNGPNGGWYAFAGHPDQYGVNLTTPANHRDGEWHELKWHYKIPYEGEGVTGIHELWWDGELLAPTGTFAHGGPETPNGSLFSTMIMGANVDPEGTAPKRDYGKIELYDTDPDW